MLGLEITLALIRAYIYTFKVNIYFFIRIRTEYRHQNQSLALVGLP